MHAEIAARRQRRCAHLWRVEWLAGLFDESVKPSLRQQFLQAIVEHVARRARHLSHPFRIFNLHTESGKPNFVNGLLDQPANPKATNPSLNNTPTKTKVARAKSRAGSTRSSSNRLHSN